MNNKVIDAAKRFRPDKTFTEQVFKSEERLSDRIQEIKKSLETIRALMDGLKKERKEEHK
jgi:hypothetical protein